jgi:hypothetical protein
MNCFIQVEQLQIDKQWVKHLSCGQIRTMNTFVYIKAMIIHCLVELKARLRVVIVALSTPLRGHYTPSHSLRSSSEKS